MDKYRAIWNETSQNRAGQKKPTQNETVQDRTVQDRMLPGGSGSQGGRVCRRCLTREMAGQERTYETIRQYIENLEEGDRTAGEVYECRLEGCKACEKLLEGLCLACGCYVEIRAARASQRCPYDRW